MPEANLPTNDKENPKCKSAYSCQIACLARQIIIQFPKAKQTAQNACNYIQNALSVFAQWLKRPQAWVQLLTLIVVAYYAYLTSELVGVSKRQLDIADRPWVGIGTITITGQLAHNVSMHVAIPLENVGRSPALHLIPHVILKAIAPRETPHSALIQDRAMCAQPTPKWEDKGEGIFYLPGKTDGGFAATSDPMPDNQVDFLNELPNAVIWPLPSLGLFLVGCIDYFDQLHNSHRTYFCQYYAEWGGAKRFIICPTDNDAD
jgi:hypothetical protein